jgi:2-oxoacid dehydrogenases acyltransferase (catalytic domain)
MRNKRPDGTLVLRVPGYRRMMPYLMKTKNTAHVYIKYTIDMEKALAFVENPPGGLKGKVSLTMIVLRALTKVLHEFPRMNRYVSGKRLYQRDGIYLSFSAKKAFDEAAPLVVIKMKFDPEESLEGMVQRITDQLAKGRSDEKSYTDKETNLVLRLPRFAIRFVVWLLSFLDYYNLVPRDFIEKDLFYASLFVANLGSVGLEAGYHHLYEYGNVPIFMCIGKVKPMPVVRDGQVVVRRVAEFKITYDERIEDGFNGALGLDRFQHYLENPEELI